jgi:hypothetical protein
MCEDNNTKYLLIPIIWKHGINAEYPFIAFVDGETWAIRINDFPENSMYTLIVAEDEVLSFDDWPIAWKMPQ